jgi:hypothetical protein
MAPEYLTHDVLAAELRLPPSAGGGADAWEYISYTHPGAWLAIAILCHASTQADTWVDA